MKIILAQCASYCSLETDENFKVLAKGLRRAGHRTDLLIIPPLGDGFEALMAAASHRLVNLRSFCDVLICLDRVACLLPHGRKFAFLSKQEPLPTDTYAPTEETYLTKLIEAGIEEAESLRLPILSKKNGQSPSSSSIDVTPLLRKLK